MARRPRQPVVLVFGESRNDVDCLRELLVALQPRLEGRVQTRLRPPSLTRSAGSHAVRTWLDRVHGVVAASVDPVLGILVHQDADGSDPTGQVYRRLKSDLAGLSVQAEAAVPVQAIEAWWLLHPAAVLALRPAAWSKVVLPKGDVELIADPKRVLQQQTRRASARHEYSEADSLGIAARIRADGMRPAQSCPSWHRLEASAATLSSLLGT